MTRRLVYVPREITLDGDLYRVVPVGTRGSPRVYRVADGGQRRRVRSSRTIFRVMSAIRSEDQQRERRRQAIEAMGGPPESGQEETVGQRVDPPEAPPGSDTGGQDG